MEVVKSRRAEHAGETRAGIVEAARNLFGERGYSAASLDDVASLARVTKGAVYHHFGGKEDVLRAVYEDVVRDLVKRRAIEKGADLWDDLRAGSRAYLDMCLDPALRRIIQDAQAVLGRDYTRRVDAANHWQPLVRGLRVAMDNGLIRRVPSQPLAHLLNAMVHQAADLIATPAHPRAARAGVGATPDG